MIESYSNSVGDNIVKEFIRPRLKGATEYWRSTGHFSSSFLISAAETFSDFFSSNKKMKVICCQELNEDDEKIIEAGNDPTKIIHDDVIENLKDLSGKSKYLKENNLKVLYWLIKTGQLEIRIGVVKAGGIHHEKYGLIYHPDGNSVFIGGFNLSLSGHMLNSESCIATDDKDTFEKWKMIFNTTWEGNSLSTKCYPFPEAAEHIILTEFEKEWGRRYGGPIPPRMGEVQIYSTLWDHQKKGFEQFFKNGKQGILQMATGTGKTKLALSIYEELDLEYNTKCCVLVASRNPLLNQWIEDIHKYFPNHGIIRRYGKYNELGDFASYADENQPVFLLTSYDLLADVEKSTRDIKENSLIICDEVHNLGADTRERDLRGLISPFTYKLGLSATPDREYDLDGTMFIQNEIGPVLFEYSLEQALKDGILCPFNYAPIEYSLTEEDKRKRQSIIGRYHSKLPNGKPAMSEEEYRRKMADVIKKSIAKLEPFKEFLKEHPSILQRSVLFVPDKAYGLKVEELISNFDSLIKYHTFYDGDSEEFLDNFSKDRLSCLITCNKISEGISISDISNVILFSASRSKTETLQRIGRGLRKDSKNPAKRAWIIDFIEKERITDKESADYERYEYLSRLCTELIK